MRLTVNELAEQVAALERRVAELEAEAERRDVSRRVERAMAGEAAPAAPGLRLGE